MGLAPFCASPHTPASIAPFGEVILKRGFDPGSFDVSMAAIKELTQRFSMEGPIRPFIDTYPERTSRCCGTGQVARTTTFGAS